MNNIGQGTMVLYRVQCVVNGSFPRRGISTKLLRRSKPNYSVRIPVGVKQVVIRDMETVLV